MTQNYINHIALVLDASGSMASLTAQVGAVADNQIAYLAHRSKELDQETRVTIYAFADHDRITCLVYDKDVLRLPSIKGLYKADGNTALLDATLKALDDLATTPELYGEHAFLTYVLTDGEENNSRFASPTLLQTRISRLPDHWTVATFVPHQRAVFEAKKAGFPAANIAVWDTTAKGLTEVGETIRKTTDNFMMARASGVRGSKNLFNLDLSKLTKANVSTLKALRPGQFRMLKIERDEAIAPFVETQVGRPYRLGEAYYQLTKPVIVQADKVLALYDRKAHTVYTGEQARQLLSLPDAEVKVSPASTPDFDIFIQSTSVNRKLFAGTSLLILS